MLGITIIVAVIYSIYTTLYYANKKNEEMVASNLYLSQCTGLYTISTSKLGQLLFIITHVMMSAMCKQMVNTIEM